MTQSVIREKNCLISSRSRPQQGFIWSKYDSFYYIFWTVDSLATKLGLLIHHHKRECLVKKHGLLHSRSRSQWRSKCFSWWYLLNCETFCYQTWYCDASSWAGVSCRKIGVLFQGHGHSKGSYDQNMTAATISSELLILLLQTWFGSTLLKARLSYGETWLLCSRSGSQQNFKV